MPSRTASTSSSFATSAWTMDGLPAPALANASQIAASSAEPHLCVRVTCAPRLPNASPVARPMPRVPPVTRTARPEKSFHIVVLDAANRTAEGKLMHQRLLGDRDFECAPARKRERALERRDALARLVGNPC